MNDKKSHVNFTAPAGSRDTEYCSINPADAVELPPPHGLQIRCPHCRRDLFMPFQSTLDAWDLVLTLITEGLGNARRDLLKPDGRRPNMQLLQARACLVQCLVKLAGEDAARHWVALHGMEGRRFLQLCQVQLVGEALRLRDQLPPALPVGTRLIAPLV